MNETLSLTKRAFVSLFDGMSYPNPDDPGPYGPIGPVIRRAFRDLPSVLLNPQPLPPKAGPSPEPWHFGPHPEPWGMAMLAHWVIDRVVAQYQQAELSGAMEQPEKSVAVARSYLLDAVDDWCGTHPRRWPWPWPPKFDTPPRPIELFAAGAQFQKAAELDNPLQAAFADAADKLFMAGMKQLAAN